MPSRDRGDGWMVADDWTVVPPGRQQAGSYGAPNGPSHAAPANGPGRPAAEMPGQYNGAYHGSWERTGQTGPAGDWYAEQRYQPRHVGRYPVRSYPPGPYSPAARATAPVRTRPTATGSARVRAPAPVEEPAYPRRARFSVVLWVVGCYLVPLLVYLVWAVTLSGDSPAGCVGPDGGPCPPPRTAAFDNLASSALGLAGALFASLVISLGLARLATDWRGFTVGFAASVIGAGATTLFISAIG